MKKIVCFFMAGMLCLLTGCGEKQTVTNIDQVELEQIEEVNDGYELLKDHDSIAYKLQIYEENSIWTEDTSVSKDGDDYVYTSRMQQSKEYRIETWKDGMLYAKNGSQDGGVTYGVCWFMSDTYQDYLEDYIEGLLISDTSDLVLEDREEGDGYYSLTAHVQEGKDKSEGKTYYEYIVDPESLKIDQFMAYYLNGSEKSMLSFAEVTYDEKVEEETFVKELQNASETRTITIYINPNEENEKKETVKISAKASFDAVLEDGYSIYTDVNGKKFYDSSEEVLGSNGLYKDLTLYIIEK